MTTRKDRSLLQDAGAQAAAARRQIRERDRAVLRALLEGWSVPEVAGVTRLSKYRVRGILSREAMDRARQRD